LKRLEENTWETLQDINTGNNFLSGSPITQETKPRMTNGFASDQKALCRRENN
jgi:hypothetical protein